MICSIVQLSGKDSDASTSTQPYSQGNKLTSEQNKERKMESIFLFTMIFFYYLGSSSFYTDDEMKIKSMTRPDNDTYDKKDPKRQSIMSVSTIASISKSV